MSDSPAGSALKGRLPCGCHARKASLVFRVGALSCRCFFAQEVHRLVGAASTGGFNTVKGFGCSVRGCSLNAYRPVCEMPPRTTVGSSLSPPANVRHPRTVKGEYPSGNAAFGATRYLRPRHESSMRRAESVFAAAKRLEFCTVRGSLRHATVDLSCSCGSQTSSFCVGISDRWKLHCIPGSLRAGHHRGDADPYLTGLGVPAPKEI